MATKKIVSKSAKKKKVASKVVKKVGAQPKKKNPPKVRVDTKKVLRFAHPFFTNTPIGERKEIPHVGKRMNDYVATKLLPIPAPIRTSSVITLAEIIGDDGVTQIQNAKSISFHAIGDTGNAASDWPQLVSDAMSPDYHAGNPAHSPAFLLHLGDVNYYENTDQGYHAQFYEPYKKYPGKIIAIPGNHDGELFNWDNKSTGQGKTLEAFMNNFCQAKPGVPPAAGTIYREMISQPGVYWLLEAPFINIIGLYSNIAEGQGYISGAEVGQQQKNWFVQTLASIKTERDKGNRKALIIVVHHPPFSNGGHEPSTDMLNDIDDACKKGGVYPDAFMAAHAHSYQAYTRFFQKMEVPYTVNGCGGRGLQPPVKANGSREGDHTYDASYNGYGFQLITVTAQELTLTFFTVDDKGNKQSYHTIVVDLKSSKVTFNKIS